MDEKPGTRIEFDASARPPSMTPEAMRERTLQITREWLEGIALEGRAVQAEDVLAFAEGYNAEPLRSHSQEGLPPVPALRAPVDADAFMKLEAVAARAAHAAVEQAAPSLTGWALAEFVEARVRQMMREFVTSVPDPDAPELPVRVYGVVEETAVRVHLARLGDGERRDVGSGPDLVSRMIDARECLRAKAGPFDTGAVAAALRWLDAGIEEGMVQRELYGRLRQLVAGEPHVCSCGGPDSCTHGRPAYEDRCRFEAALRSLLGVDG